MSIGLISKQSKSKSQQYRPFTFGRIEGATRRAFLQDSAVLRNIGLKEEPSRVEEEAESKGRG